MKIMPKKNIIAERLKERKLIGGNKALIKKTKEERLMIETKKLSDNIKRKERLLSYLQNSFTEIKKSVGEL